MKKNNPYIDQIANYPETIKTFDGKKPDWSEWFPETKPIIVDIGCGAGNFLRDMAIKEPNFNYVGMELRFKRLVKGALKFKKRAISNIRLIQERGEDIDLLFSSNMLYRIHINFPDPWAKNRQKKHRLFSLDYLTKLSQLLVPNGNLLFKTDHEEYFHFVQSLLKQQQHFIMIEYSENLHHSPYNDQNIPTEFEQLFANKGEPIYYCKLRNQK